MILVFVVNLYIKQLHLCNAEICHVIHFNIQIYYVKYVLLVRPNLVNWIENMFVSATRTMTDSSWNTFHNTDTSGKKNKWLYIIYIFNMNAIVSNIATTCGLSHVHAFTHRVSWAIIYIQIYSVDISRFVYIDCS